MPSSQSLIPPGQKDSTFPAHKKRNSLPPRLPDRVYNYDQEHSLLSGWLWLPVPKLHSPGATSSKKPSGNYLRWASSDLIKTWVIPWTVTPSRARCYVLNLKIDEQGTSLVDQWLRILLARKTEDAGSIPGQGTKIPHDARKILHAATKTQHSHK